MGECMERFWCGAGIWESLGKKGEQWEFLAENSGIRQLGWGLHCLISLRKMLVDPAFDVDFQSCARYCPVFD
nr:hypothetical protein [Tanacetum cinerariifolium]